MCMVFMWAAGKVATAVVVVIVFVVYVKLVREC